MRLQEYVKIWNAAIVSSADDFKNTAFRANDCQPSFIRVKHSPEMFGGKSCTQILKTWGISFIESSRLKISFWISSNFSGLAFPYCARKDFNRASLDLFSDSTCFASMDSNSRRFASQDVKGLVIDVIDRTLSGSWIKETPIKRLRGSQYPGIDFYNYLPMNSSRDCPQPYRNREFNRCFRCKGYGIDHRPQDTREHNIENRGSMFIK